MTITNISDVERELRAEIARLKEWAKLGLSALEYASTGNRRAELIAPAIAAFKQALVEQAAPAPEEWGPGPHEYHSLPAQQEPVAWADMEVRGEDKGLSWTQGHFRKTPLYTHHAPVNQQLLEDIAEVAHCGGLAGMSEGDALISIRKLTLPHWRKERTIEQARAAIAAAEGKV